MSKEDVYRLSAEVGIPCVHMAWPEGSAPPLPWMTFFLDSMVGFDADDEVYAQANNWCVELYQKSSDEELEARLEEAIQANFGPYRKSEAWVDSENCIQTAYYFKEI